MPFVNTLRSSTTVSFGKKRRAAGAAAAQFKLFTWGNNDSGELGLGDTVKRSSPVQVGALTDWATPVAGYTQAFCVKTDGTLWAWGSGGIGRLGLGDANINRSSPTQVGSLTNWENPSAGDNTTACTRTDGTLWAWGSNNNGQLGQNNVIYRSSPVQVGSSTTWSAVSVGNLFMVAVDNGKLFAWGTNTRGQLGLGDTVNRSSPVQVGALTTWAKPSVRFLGNAHTLCTKTDGTLWSWGYNENYGALGLGDKISRSSPVQVGALTNWVEPSVGNAFSLCTKTDGTLWSWGNNSNARLGLGNFVNRSSPVQVGNLTNWSIPAAGSLWASSTKTGTLFSWGENVYGQLGTGDVVERSSPVQVGSLFTWAKSTGGKRFCVSTQGVETSAPISLTAPIVSGTAQDGQTLSSTTGTWGQFPSSFAFQWQRGTSNISGATSSSYEIVPADVGSTLRCVVTATNTVGATAANSANTATVIAYVGKLFSWGMNTQPGPFAMGTLGDGTAINRSSPVQVGAETAWRLIQVSKTTIAVKTTGQLWTWGQNGQGGLGQNDTVYRSSPVQVGALTTWAKPGGGGGFGLCTKTDGTLWAWGGGGRGQLGQNNTANRSSPVQVGALTDWATPSTGSNYTSLCVKTDGTLWAWGYNDKGQLGQNDTANRSSPVQVGALTNWVKPVSGVSKSVLCTKTDGTLWAWGYNASGRLGLNDIIDRSSPTQVGAETHWKTPSIAYHAACTTIGGKLFTWGNSNNEKLGLNGGPDRSSPVQVGSLTNWSVAVAGAQSCVATKTDGTLWSWGGNNIGQLGNGLENATFNYGISSPVQVGSLTTWLVPSFSYRAVLCTQK